MALQGGAKVWQRGDGPSKQRYATHTHKHGHKHAHTCHVHTHTRIHKLIAQKHVLSREAESQAWPGPRQRCKLICETFASKMDPAQVRIEAAIGSGVLGRVYKVFLRDRGITAVLKQISLAGLNAAQQVCGTTHRL